MAARSEKKQRLILVDEIKREHKDKIKLIESQKGKNCKKSFSLVKRFENSRD